MSDIEPKTCEQMHRALCDCVCDVDVVAPGVSLFKQMRKQGMMAKKKVTVLYVIEQG